MKTLICILLLLMSYSAFSQDLKGAGEEIEMTAELQKSAFNLSMAGGVVMTAAGIVALLSGPGAPVVFLAVIGTSMVVSGAVQSARSWRHLKKAGLKLQGY